VEQRGGRDGLPAQKQKEQQESSVSAALREKYQCMSALQVIGSALNRAVTPPSGQLVAPFSEEPKNSILPPMTHWDLVPMAPVPPQLESPTIEYGCIALLQSGTAPEAVLCMVGQIARKLAAVLDHLLAMLGIPQGHEPLRNMVSLVPGIEIAIEGHRLPR